MYTTRHSTPIGAAKQPQYVVAQPPLNSPGLSWPKICSLCSAYLGTVSLHHATLLRGRASPEPGVRAAATAAR